MVDHYFSKNQNSRLVTSEISATLRDNFCTFITGSGVFSRKAVDKGSTLLIDSCIMQSGWRVLDIGCGYGPVGIAIAKAFPENEILMTDINERAVALTKKNVKKNSVEERIKVFSGDMYEKVEGLFDTILFNPPQTAGKDICLNMLDNAKDYLKKGGLLQFVYRHNVGGKVLFNHVKDHFGNGRDIAKKSGFRVYLHTKE